MANHSAKGNHASLAEFETKVASEVAIWRQAECGVTCALVMKAICPILMTQRSSKACPVIGVNALIGGTF